MFPRRTATGWVPAVDVAVAALWPFWRPVCPNGDRGPDLAVLLSGAVVALAGGALLWPRGA